MAESDLTKSLLSKSCNDLYDNDKNSNYKIHNESNFTRFHHYPYSGSSSFHSNFYGLIPSIPSDDETPTSNSCINIITKGAYDDGLDTPLIIKNELHIKIENDNSEDDETSTVSPTDSEIAETKHDISSYELAAIALGNTYCTVTGWSLLIGLDSAIDTLCSQAYAAAKTLEEKKIVGKILQRGFVILACFCLLIYILWNFTEPILLLLHQDPGIAHLSGRFTKYERLGLLPYIFFECEKKLLQIQGMMYVPMFIILTALPLNALLHYFFIFSSWSPIPKDIAYIGSPFSTSITFTYMCIVGILYIKFVKGKDCWGGIDLKSIFNFKLWIEFLKLGIPGAFMVSNEWWAYEVCALFAGILGDKQLAVHSIFSSITNYSYNIPLGLSMATTLRIGNNLGEKNALKTKISSRISLIMAFIFGILNSFVLLIFRKQLPKIFTNNHKVIETCAETLIIGAFYQLSDGLAAVGNGILRGSGHQKIGAYINFLGFWIIGLPFGALACFVFKWNLNGIWIGMATALLSVSLLQLIKIYRIDWSEEIEIAAERFRKN